MKYVKFTLQEMTPEQIKQNPITVQHQKLDTEEGESNTDEQESTISNKEEEEYSTPTFSDMSKQDSESDINVDDTQDEQNSQTPETPANT